MGIRHLLSIPSRLCCRCLRSAPVYMEALPSLRSSPERLCEILLGSINSYLLTIFILFPQGPYGQYWIRSLLRFRVSFQNNVMSYWFFFSCSHHFFGIAGFFFQGRCNLTCHHFCDLYRNAYLRFRVYLPYRMSSVVLPLLFFTRVTRY